MRSVTEFVMDVQQGCGNLISLLKSPIVSNGNEELRL